MEHFINFSDIVGYIINSIIGLIGVGIITVLKMLKKQNDFIPKVNEHMNNQHRINKEILQKYKDIKEEHKEDSKNLASLIKECKADTYKINLRLTTLETEHNQFHKK